jgi:hypothetical protein
VLRLPLHLIVLFSLLFVYRYSLLTIAFLGYEAMIRAIYREAYDLKKCAHVGHLARLVENRENAYEGLQRLGVIHNDAVRDHRVFPSFQTRGIDSYNGRNPSRRFLQSLFVKTTHGDIAIYETLMALNADTDILSADDSYKVFSLIVL